MPPAAALPPLPERAHDEPVLSEEEEVLVHPGASAPSQRLRLLPARAPVNVTPAMVAERQRLRERPCGPGTPAARKALHSAYNSANTSASHFPPPSRASSHEGGGAMPLPESNASRPQSAPIFGGGGKGRNSATSASGRVRFGSAYPGQALAPGAMKRPPLFATHVSKVPMNDPESMADEVLQLKKELTQLRMENRELRIAAQQTHVELRRVEREADAAAQAGFIFDGIAPRVGGTAVRTRRGDAHLIKGLKKQAAFATPSLPDVVRELQRAVRDKEAEVEAEKASAKSARLRELQVQARTYYEEVRRLQLLLKLNAEGHAKEREAMKHQHDNQLNSLRREHEVLRQQNASLDDELGRWMDENDELRNLVNGMERRQAEGSPARERDNSVPRRARQQIRERLETKLNALHREEMARLREELVRETTKLVAELEAEQGAVRKLEAANRKLKVQNEAHCRDLAEANARLEQHNLGTVRPAGGLTGGISKDAAMPVEGHSMAHSQPVSSRDGTSDQRGPPAPLPGSGRVIASHSARSLSADFPESGTQLAAKAPASCGATPSVAAPLEASVPARPPSAPDPKATVAGLRLPGDDAPAGGSEYPSSLAAVCGPRMARLAAGADVDDAQTLVPGGQTLGGATPEIADGNDLA